MTLQLCCAEARMLSQAISSLIDSTSPLAKPIIFLYIKSEGVGPNNWKAPKSAFTEFSRFSIDPLCQLPLRKIQLDSSECYASTSAVTSTRWTAIHSRQQHHISNDKWLRYERDVESVIWIGRFSYITKIILSTLTDSENPTETEYKYCSMPGRKIPGKHLYMCGMLVHKLSPLCSYRYLPHDALSC